MTSSTTAPEVAQNDHAHTDPAAVLTKGDAVPVQTRSERPRSFEVSDFGTPTGREVNWKHTPVARLGSFFEPAGDSSAVAYDFSTPEYIAPGLAVGTAPRGEFFQPEDVTAAAAWQGSAEALHVRIPRDHEAAEPIFIKINGTDASARADAHIVLEGLEHSSATIVMRHTGAAQYAQNVEIIAREGANLTVISVQEWDDEALHLSAHQARVDANATLKHFVISFGGGVVRVNPNVELAGAGAECNIYGLSYGDAGQHLESQVYMYHKGAHTTGDVLYKGALQGEGARSVWIGDVLIGPDATGTTSYEANRNLLLTEGTRADSIPNLEIETGDILGAGHASATGRFDDEQLFYLQSRGITEEQARHLVVIGFLSDVVQRLGIPTLEEELLVAIETELAEVNA